MDPVRWDQQDNPNNPDLLYDQLWLCEFDYWNMKDIELKISREAYFRHKILGLARVDCQILIAEEMSLVRYRMTFYHCLQHLVVLASCVVFYLFHVGKRTHGVIGVAAKENSINLVIFLWSLYYFAPSSIAEVIFGLFLSQIEMFHIQLLPQLMRKDRNLPNFLSFLPLPLYKFAFLIFNNHSQLRIPRAFQRSIVDVGRPYQSYPIVDDHQFAMNVDYFGYWGFLDQAVVSQTENEEVLLHQGGGRDCLFYYVVQDVDCCHHMVKLDPENCCGFIRGVTVETWKGW